MGSNSDTVSNGSVNSNVMQELAGMSLKQLKIFARENDLDVSSATSKKGVLDAITNQLISINVEEDTQMSANMMEDEVVVTDEMTGTEFTGTEVDGVGSITEVGADKRTWHDAEGNEVSMSQFIREQFLKNHKSRKEIAEAFDINYRTVYGATVNMVNDAEPASRGRGVVNPKIKVTADDTVLIEKTETIDGIETKVFMLDGEVIDAETAAALEVVETDRNTWIKNQVTAGKNRGDIAKALELSYGVVYGLTKEEEGTRQKHEVELPDGTKVGRSEYIRARVAEGISKADIAKELGVEYSVVWQATKKDKTEAEKFAGLIESLEKMADSFGDAKEAYLTSIQALQTFKVVEVEANDTPAADAEVVAEA